MKNKLYIEMAKNEVIDLFSEKYNLDFENAKSIFEKSKTYKVLQDESTRLWTESSKYILEDLEVELDLKQ